ncbi:T-cell surface glycoprotein CD8 alpha chain, partial [Megadyptes antipodes antipodes]
MAGSPAQLLLLALGLCEYGHGGQEHQMRVRFRDSSITHPQLGQRLELECLTTNDDSGVFWVRLDKDGTLHFIVFISSLSRITFAGNKGTSRRFEATKTRRFYQLVVKSFMPQDEGNYFCLMNSNQMLYFSPGQPAFFPVTSTAAPTTPAPTMQRGITEKDPCLKTPNPETIKEKELNFFCDIFIWVPLAGACLLLITALAVTIMLCQRKAYPRTPCRY